MNHQSSDIIHECKLLISSPWQTWYSGQADINIICVNLQYHFIGIALPFKLLKFPKYKLADEVWWGLIESYYYFWQSFANVYSMRAHQTLNKFDAPHFVLKGNLKKNGFFYIFPNLIKIKKFQEQLIILKGDYDGHFFAQGYFGSQSLHRKKKIQFFVLKRSGV